MFHRVVQGNSVVNGVDDCHNAKYESHFNCPAGSKDKLHTYY